MRINAWNELGHAYRKIGDMDNSFKHYERALQINPPRARTSIWVKPICRSASSRWPSRS